MDLFATALAAAGAATPDDRTIDGKDLLPLLEGRAEGPHVVIFGQQGAPLATVRDGRWKLHVLPASDRREPMHEGRWVDPRGPDGVTLLAPYEQYQPTDYPGLRTGDAPRPSLFDLEHDPGEQHDVAAEHPDVVARLKARYEKMTQLLAAAAPGRLALAGP
jgi:arylsulfatase A-like enzyme